MVSISARAVLCCSIDNGMPGRRYKSPFVQRHSSSNVFNSRPRVQFPFIMRFSITSLFVIGTYLLTTARAGELAASTEATQFGSAVQSGPSLRELLIERQGCQQGFGVCSNTGSCCPLGGGCCSNGRSREFYHFVHDELKSSRLSLGKCCGTGNWCYTDTSESRFFPG